MIRRKLCNIISKKEKIFYFLQFAVASICLNIAIIDSAYAGLDELMKFAAPEGSMSSVNSPAIIQDQSGGYMTGGSILLRGPKPKELQPLSVQTPKLKFDACTGSADLRFGAMSYIKASEFVTFLKSVATASGAYLVKMSIKSVCPQCEDIMTYLETVARDINGLTMDQCAMAQSIAEGAFSKLRAGEKQHCMMNANATKAKADITATTSSCQDEAGDKIADSKEFESLLGDEFNLVWKALSDSANASTDLNLKELMMSVSGTVIGIKENGRYKFTLKPTLLEDEDLLEKYMGTGSGNSKVKLYVCNENVKCLHPQEQEVVLKLSETLYGNVSKIIEGLIKKVQKDDPDLTDEEKALISFSTIPILHLIEMDLATKANTQGLLVRIDEFIKVICYDVITNFMQVMLNRVVTNVQALEHVTTDDVVISRFIQGTENIRRYLADAKFGAFQKLQVITQIKERLEMQTKEFEFRFGKMMQNLES